MKLIEFASCEEGFMLQVFSFLRFGMACDRKPDDELGPYTAIIIGIWKFQAALSLEWRKHVDISKNIW